MKTIHYSQANFDRLVSELYDRPSYPPEIEDSVKTILADVKKDGDDALIKYAKEFDNVDLTSDCFLVTEDELNAAADLVDQDSKDAINLALANVKSFAQERIPKEWTFSPRDGVTLGERFEPMDRVGVYIPGGTAPLASTVIHTAGIAAAAGVKEIVAVTPPGKDGKIHPGILYAMKQAGVSEVYRLGGVYGIAALAYGTATIDKVEKIVGPGNAYVTAAKKLVYGEVAIDMVAGPSEIMILGDDSVMPHFVAADMLSQAEHGSGLEQAVFVTTDAESAQLVEREILEQANALSRSETINKVLDKGIFFIVVEDIEQAVEVASKYAPEHLEVMCRDADHIARQVKAAGAIFIGPWTPEPVGDFVAGPSHVLPTAGSARFFSGLTVEGFFRRMSLVKYSRPALEKELPAIKKFAEMEGLDAHGNSAAIRFQ